MAPRLPPGYFVTATGTGCGKTYVTRGLARAWTRKKLRVAAIKPIETGCDERGPMDAVALARAAGDSELARASGLYRAAPPLAPYAVSLLTGEAAPNRDQLTTRIAELSTGSDRVLVEGAGGLWVPLDAHHTIAELADDLALPLLVVAPDQLGVLSHVLTLAIAIAQQRLPLAALVLVRHEPTTHAPAAEADPSPQFNARILGERLPCPVLNFPACPDDDEALADAADACGLSCLDPLPVYSTRPPVIGER